MTRLARAAERLIDALERTEVLDGAADAVAAVVRRVVRPGVVEDTLSGTQVGHPVHPAVVAVPIGAWLSANVLDLLGADEAATSAVQAIGLIGAVPAAATGASDWLSTAGPERRVGLVHAVSNYSAIALHASSLVARRRGKPAAASALGLAGSALAGAGGWLGGHLAYALGVGVDTTVFQQFPAEWTDAVADADVRSGELVRAEVTSVPVLLARVGGRVVAYADRCTHRGAPLDEGTLADGCVTCPWHDSVFDLEDGSVVSGPATRPQPALEVRVVAGRVQVRRTEHRTLRTNPV